MPRNIIPPSRYLLDVDACNTTREEPGDSREAQNAKRAEQIALGDECFFLPASGCGAAAARVPKVPHSTSCFPLGPQVGRMARGEERAGARRKGVRTRLIRQNRAFSVLRQPKRDVGFVLKYRTW